ncbi:Gfo/Idh/MocA family protein [Spongiactinospora rosea]|uniref:Gfo/Idh/MocA family protein n=1 Tax=Spongiactinospora rosea TaxID=2248750 RepID=UPI001314A8C1|nr:Gfo/Idh/MocA family oxidoreductase [Spongiactinospora rosea]
MTSRPQSWTSLPRTRVAVLGTAHVHLPDHLAAVAADDDAEPVAVLEHADAVIICSTTAGHRDLLRRAVAAGLPALVEKPLAAGAAETAALAALACRARAPVTTAMFLRCAPSLRRAARLLADGDLGEPVAADLSFSHAGLLDGTLTADSAAWMLDPRRAGPGGAFADLGVHLVDLLRWLRPGAEIAVRGAVLRHRPEYAVNIGGTALLDWDGVPVTVHADWTTRPGGLLVRLHGTRGTVIVRDGEVAAHVGGTRRVERLPPPSAGHATTAFLAALRGRESWRAPDPADMVACAVTLEEALELGGGISADTPRRPGR